MNYWPCVIVCVGFGWFDTNQIHAACYKVVGSSPAAANFFFISVFNLGIATGAKVGLKLRLLLGKPYLSMDCNLHQYYYILFANLHVKAWLQFSHCLTCMLHMHTLVHFISPTRCNLIFQRERHRNDWTADSGVCSLRHINYVGVSI